VRLVLHVDGGPRVRLPAGRARPVEVAQVVEAFVGAPAEHPARMVEGGRPVHEAIGAERAGGAVLQPRVLPIGHPFDYADTATGALSDPDSRDRPAG